MMPTLMIDGRFYPFTPTRFVRRANDGSVVPRVVAPLAHCPDCDLWLRPSESCLHISQTPPALCGRQPRPVGLSILSDGSGLSDRSFHDAGDTHVGQ